VCVYKIVEMDKGDAIVRELVLIKVAVAAEKRNEVIEIANVFRAKVVDVGRTSITIEATGDEHKLAGLENLLRAYGIKEITRTGKIAMKRSAQN
jgi:acetolactate synthase-1/3 small subunit